MLGLGPRARWLEGAPGVGVAEFNVSKEDSKEDLPTQGPQGRGHAGRGPCAGRSGV